jgi:hypothetical protein
MSLKLRLGKMTIGNSSVSIPMIASEKLVQVYGKSTATSGEDYAAYFMLSASGAAGESIATRGRTVLTAAKANAHGAHNTLELGTGGSVSGLGTGTRSNIIVPDSAVAAGTYYAMMAEIYTGGNTSALPTNSNAALCINVVAGTAMDLVANAIAFNGTDGDGKMIYTGAVPDTLEGSIRVLINGVKHYIPVYTKQKA